MSIPLQNNHNVYILGAGFSRGAEMPLICDFLVRMRDSHEWLLRQDRKEEADAVEKVLQFRLDAASAAYWVNLDLENIEELFSLASASKGEMHQQIQLAIAATLDFARETTRNRKYRMTVRGSSQMFRKAIGKDMPDEFPKWACPADTANEHLAKDELIFNMGPYEYYVARLLGMFQNGEPLGQNTFISFNYDTILEDAMKKLGIEFCYGFKPKTVNFEKGPNKGGGDPDIHVLKLHGSVNWARRMGRGRSLTVFEDYKEVLEANLVPELIPPTWKKVFENQLEAVWETAVQRINSATRVIIIGFSMPPTDVHFKYLMAAGLQNNLSLRKILFVNPTPAEDLEQRVRKILRPAYVDTRQIEFATVAFEEFVRGERHYLPQIGRPFEYGITTTVHWSA